MSAPAIAIKTTGINYVPVGAVFHIVGGGTPSKRVASYYDGDIPWATIRDMHSPELRETEHKITKQGLEHSSSKLVPAGEVIMASRVGLGKACIVKQDTAINQDIRALIPRVSESIDRRFCLYWLQSLADSIVAAGTGATVKGIKLPFIKSLPFPDVPIEEQKRIVAVLDRAFAALDRTCAYAEANLAEVQKLFDSLLNQTFQEREKWPREDLSKRVRFIDYRGKTPPKGGAGIRLVTAKNVRMGYIKKEPREFVPEDTYDAWMTRGFPAFGDVLFTTEAPLANVAQLDTKERVVIGQRLITMQSDPTEIVPEFLKWSLISPQMQRDIRSNGTGATVLGIKAKLLKKIAFYVPPDIVEQARIAATCELAFKKKGELEARYRNKLANIATLRQSILKRAFAGEL